MKKTVAIFISIAAISGCTSSTGLGRAMSYPSKTTQVTMADDTYRVFEHATDNTLMTTPSIGRSASMGIAQSATLGIASAASMSPQQRHEAAAKQYLVQTGRANCTITNGHVLAAPQYEFTYSCSAKPNSTFVGNG